VAIQWGSWQYGGGNGMRVGLDISWSAVTFGSTTTTATVEVWTDNQYRYNDFQEIDISNNLGSNFDYNNQQTTTATKRLTRTYTHTYGANPATITFGATVRGTYNNITPSVSIASTTPTVPTPVAPTAPGISATPGNGFVDFSFTAPSSGGTGGVSYYQSSADNINWSNNPANPFRINGTNGTSVSGYIRAVNAYGQAGPSAGASATPRTTPGPPTSFTSNTSTFGQVSLSWAAPSSNGGSGVTGYVLRNGSTVLQNSTATSYTHTGLSPYTDYSYTVTARNIVGEGAAASLTAKTLGGIGKIWNGTSWVTVLPKVWNGSSWINSQTRIYDGVGSTESDKWKYGI
jgi:titin